MIIGLLSLSIIIVEFSYLSSFFDLSSLILHVDICINDVE